MVGTILVIGNWAIFTDIR